MLIRLARRFLVLLVSLLAASVLKYAHRTMPDLSHTSDDDAVDRTLDRAIAVFRTAFKEIS